ncbi:coproporphyrinogen III oxidase [Candidatus Clostridium radicumherbarum]|uniref:Coproporphyrinogen III oxidase n=1 Tax=Candidatus Clostridium radicumherbarum TaxID=3381662 RepID=A0ABW8TR95_9CLOT
MMIKVYLNDFKYRYDVFQIINLYFTLSDIEFVNAKEGKAGNITDVNNAGNDANGYSTSADYYITITDNKILIKDSSEEYQYVFKRDIKLSDEIKLGIFLFLKNKTKMNFPWGIMLGIRPSKIAVKLLKEGSSEVEIIDYYKKHYEASEEKARLCIDIARLENSYINTDSKNISIYIGMPFCPTRCSYCSFASNPITSCSKLVEPYLEALTKELLNTSRYLEENKLKVQCVYFGGGTPTSINEIQFENLMKTIYNEIIVKYKPQEFTVECGRPDSITENKLITMKNYAVNRISINPQSMNDSTLKRIGRAHTAKDVVDKFNLAREIGFDNINMDIIVGLENEGLEEIDNTCSEILKLKPDSITVHGLAIKRASRIHEKLLNGQEVKNLCQDEIIKMYNKTAELAKLLNMKPYYMYRQKNMIGNMENIGYAAAHKEGLYNIQMIEEKQTIIAHGADAASKAVFLEEDRLERHFNVKDVKEYISRIDEMIDKKNKLLNSLYK